MRNLVHRAALIARGENAASITAAHIDLAVRHGELAVEDVEAINQNLYLREVFRHTLQERGIQIQEQFAYQELTQVTRQFPAHVAVALLKCALVPRATSDIKKKYYELHEIETALTFGMSRNSFLGKWLTAMHVRQAAMQEFGMQSAECTDDMKLWQIVNNIREMALAKVIVGDNEEGPSCPHER